jgi:predicted ribosomally synthesized peptide with nif11-like leader
MSVSLFERLKEFLVRLVKDQSFRTELDNGTVEECQQILKSAGYIFSKEEFETAAIHVLESKERGEFSELNEEELAGVLGGCVGGKFPIIIPPKDGVVTGPPLIWWSGKKPFPGPIYQPVYGAPTTM